MNKRCVEKWFSKVNEILLGNEEKIGIVRDIYVRSALTLCTYLAGRVQTLIKHD